MPTDKNPNIDNINRRAMVAKDKYWKREEELARSGRTGGILGAASLYGLNVGFKANAQANRVKFLNMYRDAHKQMGRNIAEVKEIGRDLYSKYYDWATAQKPYDNDFLTWGQLKTNQKFQNNLSEVRDAVLTMRQDRKNVRQNVHRIADAIRANRGAQMFKLDKMDAALVGLSGLGALYHHNKLNEALAKRQSTGYASEKTASVNNIAQNPNLPDLLRYTHTVDAEVIPEDISNRLELLKKYRKQLAYGGAVAALAGSALYAAHKHRGNEKTANVVYVDPKAYDALRYNIAPDIPRDWSVSNMVGAHLPTVGTITGTLLGTTGVVSKEWPLAAYGAGIAGGSYLAGKGANALYAKLNKQTKTASNADANKDDKGFLARYGKPLLVGAGIAGAGLLAYKRGKLKSLRPSTTTAATTQPNLKDSVMQAGAKATESANEFLANHHDDVAKATDAFKSHKDKAFNNMAERHDWARQEMQKSFNKIFGSKTKQTGDDVVSQIKSTRADIDAEWDRLSKQLDDLNLGK